MLSELIENFGWKTIETTLRQALEEQSFPTDTEEGHAFLSALDEATWYDQFEELESVDVLVEENESQKEICSFISYRIGLEDLYDALNAPEEAYEELETLPECFYILREWRGIEKKKEVSCIYNGLFEGVWLSETEVQSEIEDWKN